MVNDPSIISSISRHTSVIKMSATFSDGSYDLYYTHGFTLVAVSLLVVFYLSSMKMCFGTYFLRTAVSNYKSNKVVRARYYELFTARDNLMYHISWAKSRGDLEEAKNLLRQLDSVDKELDSIESSNGQLFGIKKRSGEKHA